MNVHSSAMPGFGIDGADVMVYAGVELGRLGAAAEDQTGHWGLGIIELGGRVSFPRTGSRLTP